MHPPCSVPPNSTQNNEQVPEAGACCLQAIGTNSGQSAAFPKDCPSASMAMPGVTGFSGEPGLLLYQMLPTPSRRLHSLSDPQLLPKGQNKAQGLWEHHITSDRGKPFQDSLQQHLGCRHIASHGAFPCESFGFTARTQKL